MTTKKHNAGFQTVAIANIHESTTNPRRTFDESKLAELAEVFVARDSSSPLPFGPTARAMRSSRERGASVPPILPKWTRCPSASCSSPTSRPLSGS
jgi:hypothetical protein